MLIFVVPSTLNPEVKLFIIDCLGIFVSVSDLDAVIVPDETSVAKLALEDTVLLPSEL